MDELKVYSQEVINDNPFPQEEVDITATKTDGSGVYSPKTIPDQLIPRKKTSVELINSHLNTQSRKILGKFEFTKQGAIQVGAYEEGETGDIKISPDGITARNKSGVTTFAIDGDTGDATFKGTVEAGSVIAGDISADQISAGNLDIAVGVGTGASSGYIRLDGANNRIIINDGTNDRILIGYQLNGF